MERFPEYESSSESIKKQKLMDEISDQNGKIPSLEFKPLKKSKKLIEK